ncbi:multidrug transporter [Dictyobacter vulcani]|uniref:Multidrug transporter n=1 Tax=Dictyobacter vulcani TaxID=2607529 RepID=A0A5J4KMS7_9CHLR|nr:DMT family transporter [Dictyobacter vulcani]GER91018.1 multidrug transporter [Dictyobacter vulcani]
MKKFTASMLVLMGAASFGVLSTIVKLSYGMGFSTAEVTSSPLFFGCLCLWILGIPSFKELRQLSFMTISKLLVSGIFSGLTGVFYYLALQSLPASLGVILLFQFVWMGFLLEWILQKRRPGSQQWIAITIVLIGTVLAAGYEALHFEHLSMAGILLGLLAAASYTGNIAVNGRVELNVSPILRSTLMVTGGAIITMLIFPPLFLFNGSLVRGLWIFALLLAIFGVIIPPYLYARGIPTIGSAMASILGSIELPVVIITSALILKEHITPIQWLGVILILFGIFISEQRIFNRKMLKRRIQYIDPYTTQDKPLP